MSSDKIKEFLTVSLLIIVSSLLMSVPFGMPILFSALTTALIGYTVTRFHYGFVSFSVFLVLAVHILFYDNTLTSILTALPCVLCGLAFGICYNLKLSISRLIAVPTGVYLLNTILNMKSLSFSSSGQSLFEEVISSAGQVYREALSQMSGAEITEYEISSLVSELTSTLFRFIPSFILIACIIFSLVCYYIFKRTLEFRKNDVSTLTAFSEWKADKLISIIFFVLPVILFTVPSGAYVSDILLNMVMINLFVFYIFGLSYIDFLLKKSAKRSYVRKIILLAISFISIMFTGIPFILISSLGALDGCFNLRQRKKDA